MVEISGIELREYQRNILKTCIERNTLIILPTGTGKTIIALALTAYILNKFPDYKILFLAPTKPLAVQHKKTFTKYLTDIDKTRLVLATGDTPPDVRKEKYSFGSIIFGTPQTIQNDLFQKRIDFSKFSLVIFDEAHRAVGKYSYVFIAKAFLSKSPVKKVLALTASPGYDLDRIREVIRNLGIEAIEIRTGREPDIAKYMKSLKIERIEVVPDEKFKELDRLLRDSIDIRYSRLKEMGILTKKPKGKKEWLLLVKDLRKQVETGNNQYWEALKIASEIVKLQHALEVFETQTYHTFVKYVDSLFEKNNISSTRALRNVLEDIRLRKVYVTVKQLLSEGKEHPKLKKLVKVIKKLGNESTKILIFAQLKITVERINEILQKEGIKSRIFVGKSGMSRKEQINTLERFSMGEFNVLVSTSVGEEGIDIPKVDYVIFYEPVSSEIRHIQRRGRTGRGEEGKVLILITKGTMDENIIWAAFKRERKMVRNILWLKRKIREGELLDMLSRPKDKQITEFHTVEKRDEKHKTLDEFGMKERKNKGKMIQVIADYREKDSGIIQELVSKGILVGLDNLDVGDYIVGNYVIERKTARDFINSLKDGRLKEQIEKLKEAKNPILILEGFDVLYEISDIPINLIRKTLLDILLGYNIPIMYTRDFKDTANFIISLIKSGEEAKILKLQSKNSDKSIYEIQKQILQSFPGIGEKYAEKLLQKFGSLEKIFLASTIELSRVLGEERARKFKEILKKGKNEQKTFI